MLKLAIHYSTDRNSTEIIRAAGLESRYLGSCSGNNETNVQMWLGTSRFLSAGR